MSNLLTYKPLRNYIVGNIFSFSLYTIYFEFVITAGKASISLKLKTVVFKDLLTEVWNLEIEPS